MQKYKCNSTRMHLLYLRIMQKSFLLSKNKLRFCISIWECWEFRRIAVSVIIPKRFLHNYLGHVCAISLRTSWCTLYVLWTHNSPFSTKLRTRILLFTVQPHVGFMVTATTKYPSVLKRRWRKRLRLLSENVIWCLVDIYIGV